MILPPGQQMVECFKPFLRHLLDLNLSAKTLRKHRDNLWLLGGEIISDLHQEPSAAEAADGASRVRRPG